MLEEFIYLFLLVSLHVIVIANCIVGFKFDTDEWRPDVIVTLLHIGACVF